MTREIFLTCNAGSSSFKGAVYDGGLTRLWRFTLDERNGQRSVTVKDAQGRSTQRKHTEGAPLDLFLDWLDEAMPEAELAACGHRIVQGGEYGGPVILDDGTLAKLNEYAPLAPLHQPHNLGPVEALRIRFPDILQTGSFDTAFHRTMSETVTTYALPEDWRKMGIHRYGYHGLSYDYIASRLPEYLPEARRVIVLHLGSGCSACAMLDGKSIATSMGMTALEGLVMDTRSGSIDPGIPTYLMRAHGLSGEEVEQTLYRNSGLKGLSGISSDMRDLLASDAAAAKQAIAVFCLQAAREVGALIPLLGGLDAVVFTGAMGVNAPRIRKLIMDFFAWHNLWLDDTRNEKGELRLSAEGSLPVLAMPTDEELVIARQTHALWKKHHG